MRETVRCEYSKSGNEIQMKTFRFLINALSALRGRPPKSKFNKIIACSPLLICRWRCKRTCGERSRGSRSSESRQYAYGYGLLTIRSFPATCMKLMLDLSTSKISQYHQSLPSKSTAYSVPKLTSLIQLFSKTLLTISDAWIGYFIQSCVDNIQKRRFL
jgi:hypothetical protein